MKIKDCKCKCVHNDFSFLIPKGHGRLIDEEQIPGDGGWDFSDRLMLTPTIIEADKEREVEK